MPSQVKAIIGFDLDGVIVDHSRPKFKWAAKFGFPIKLQQTSSDAIGQHLPLPILANVQKMLYDHPKFSLESPLMEDAKTVLGNIKKQKLKFFLVSRRKKPELAVALLKRHKLWPRYFNKKNSFFVETSQDKNKVAEKLGITHYLDDETKVLEHLISVKNKFLFDQFSVSSDSENYSRVGSWEEFENKILK